MTIVLVSPLYRTGAALPELVERIDAVLTEGWVLRLVADGCAEDAAIAERIAEADPRVRVTRLESNVGQHRAIALGLAAEPDADAWVCLDSDLQDPPEALPRLLGELRSTGAAVVFAGRRGAYESRGRRLTGELHRGILGRVAGLPGDAGAYFAMDRRGRDAVVAGVLERDCPSVVLATTLARSTLADASLGSVPVEREVRREGGSAWTSRARLRQSLASLGWAVATGTPFARSHALPRQLASFALIGAAGSIAYFALYALLRIGLPPEFANTVARVGIAIPTTWLNARLTFGARLGWPKLLLATAATLVLTAALTDGLLGAEQAAAGRRNLPAEAVVVVLGQALAIALRFVLLRRIFAGRGLMSPTASAFPPLSPLPLAAPVRAAERNR